MDVLSNITPADEVTCPGVRLVAGASDLRRLLHLVARLVVGGPVCAQSDHTAGETRQVAHLVLQQPSFPLRYVGQPVGRLPHQIGFYGLEERMARVSLGL